MVIREDRAVERFSLRHGMTALPISVEEDVHGKMTYTVYGKLCRKVKAFEKAEKCPFDDDGMRELAALAEPLMKKRGFALRDECTLLLNYSAKTPLPYPDTDCVILKTNAELALYEADTTLWRLELNDDVDADVISAVIENGRLVAFAGVNDIGTGCDYEINVECAAQYRRRGFATSCVRGLVNYLFESADASTVKYICRTSNTASVNTAKRAGLEYTGRSLTLVYDR